MQRRVALASLVGGLLAASAASASIGACSGTEDAAIDRGRGGDGTNETPSPSDAGGSGEAPTPDEDAGTPAPDAGEDAGSSPPKNYALGISAGCAKDKSGTGVQDRTMTIAGKTRQYLRFIPGSYEPKKPTPVVFALHGSGGNRVDARARFGIEKAADGPAIYIYPQGLPDPAYDDANRWATEKDSVDFQFLDAMLAEVETTHCVDRDRVFMTGFSHGARMTSMVGCFRGDTIRAIAPVAPGGNATTLPLAGCVGEVAIWEGWGTRDADHEEGAVRVRDHYRRANGCTDARDPVTPKGCEEYVGCRAEVPSVWCTYDLDHTWPDFGGSAVWKFFDRIR